MADFRSPINTGLPNVPDGIPDEYVAIFTSIFGAIRTLQQAIGDYSGIAYRDLDYFFGATTPGSNFAQTIQIQNQTIINVVSGGAVTNGNLVNLYDNGTTIAGRNAQANAMATRAWGWALNSVAGAGSPLAVALFRGYSGFFTGMTRGGTYWLSSVTPGGITLTKPVAVGTISQEIGLALSASELLISIEGQPIQN